MIRHTPLAAVLLATGLVLVGCGTAETGATGDRPSPAPSTAPTPPTAAATAGAAAVPTVPAEAGHLHGLGIDPADGRLYLGTHVGLMVLDGDQVRRVGDATIDLMGFAVAGPRHYYASGHPGPDDDLPDPVGLVETTDGGRTWALLSRAGVSDFHTLAAGGGRVYGYDGRIRTTTDGRSWTDGAADVRPASLAVRPGTPTTVVATTQQGPVRSTDGGVSFQHLDGAPLLVLLAWTTDDELLGVDPDGAVHASGDGGTTWEQRGSAGSPPEAFTAAGADVVVAVAAHLLRSRDGGRTFTVLAHKQHP
jgi:hypothetical protein